MLQANFYQKQKEEPYANVPKCYSIWLCNFDPFGDKVEMNTVVPFREEIGMISEDGVVRIFIDIRKWWKFNPKLQELFKFILDSSEENGLHAKWDIVQSLYRNMINIKQNDGKEREFMQFGKARESGYIEGWYEGREDGFEFGKNEGIKEGLVKGEIKKQNETIINMHLEGLDLALISKVTKCSIQEIEEVINSSVTA